MPGLKTCWYLPSPREVVVGLPKANARIHPNTLVSSGTVIPPPTLMLPMIGSTGSRLPVIVPGAVRFCSADTVQELYGILRTVPSAGVTPNSASGIKRMPEYTPIACLGIKITPIKKLRKNPVRVLPDTLFQVSDKYATSAASRQPSVLHQADTARTFRISTMDDSVLFCH